MDHPMICTPLLPAKYADRPPPKPVRSKNPFLFQVVCSNSHFDMKQYKLMKQLQKYEFLRKTYFSSCDGRGIRLDGVCNWAVTFNPNTFKCCELFIAPMYAVKDSPARQPNKINKQHVRIFEVNHTSCTNPRSHRWLHLWYDKIKNHERYLPTWMTPKDSGNLMEFWMALFVVIPSSTDYHIWIKLNNLMMNKWLNLIQ